MAGIRKDLFRPGHQLEISIFGLGSFGSRVVLLVGLGCQLDGVLGLPFIWKSLQPPLPQEADRVLDSEPSYYPSLLKFIFALLRSPALFPTLDIKTKVS